MPVIQHEGKWFRIAIEQVFSYGRDERRMGFAVPGVQPVSGEKALLRLNNFKGTWEQIGVPGVHLVDVSSERDWQPIYDAISAYAGG